MKKNLTNFSKVIDVKNDTTFIDLTIQCLTAPHCKERYSIDEYIMDGTTDQFTATSTAFKRPSTTNQYIPYACSVSDKLKLVNVLMSEPKAKKMNARQT